MFQLLGQTQCKSKNCCRCCNRKHHTSLCVGTENSTETKSTPIGTLRDTSSGQPTDTTTTLTTLTSNHSAAGPSISRVCLLKTAMTNILFDEGSQRSFLTRDLAETLCLQPTGKENICISSLGIKTLLSQTMEVGSIYVKTRAGRSVPIYVLIVPDIAVPLKNIINEVVT